MDKIPKRFIKWAKEHFADNIDKIDFHAEYDRTLNIEENKQIFQQKFKNLFIEYPFKLTRTEMLQKQQEMFKDSIKAELESRFGIAIKVV